MSKPPPLTSPIMRAIQLEAKRQGMTAYRLAQATGLAVNTAQRILDGVGAPTLPVVEAVAGALGMKIEIRRT